MKYKMIAAALLVAGITPAMAAGPNYNYVDAGYVRVDVDGGGTFNGFGIGGSVGVAERVHLVASYQDVSSGGLSISTTALGGGYNMPFTDTSDFVARGGLLLVDAGVTGLGSFNDDGFFVEAGVRSMFSDSLEVNGFVTHADAGGSDTSIGAGMVFRPSNRFGITAGISFSDDATGFTIGGRFSF